jgi:hypothetical protein
MWTCPKCGYQFFNTNQSHSCGNYTFEDFVEGKSVEAISLLKYFLSEYRKIGKFDLHPVKTRVTLLTKIRFCSINKIGEDFIDVHFVLTRRYNDSSCFHRIDNLANRFFVHHLKIRNKSDVTSEVRRFMRLAYDVGNRKHIASKIISDS